MKRKFLSRLFLLSAAFLPLLGVTHTSSGQQSQKVRIKLVGFKANKITDGFLNGPSDEPYVMVYRGVGITQIYRKRINLPSIKKGETKNVNEMLYDGPAILGGRKDISLDLWEDDDGPNDDDLIGGLTCQYENSQLKWSGAQDKGLVSGGTYDGCHQFSLQGAGGDYSLWIKADLY